MGFFNKIFSGMKNVGKAGDTAKKKPKRKPKGGCPKGFYWDKKLKKCIRIN